MRTISLYKHGLTMGTPPKSNNHTRSKRSIVSGWSASSTRSNTSFLRSVDDYYLPATEDGECLCGFSCTFTVRDCPKNFDDWQRLRTNLLKRLRRLGLYRFHWLTEWQRRGVPHFHMALWFNSDSHSLQGDIINSWTTLSKDYRSSPLSQYVTPIYDSVGWFKYLSKHASRGLSNYQRSSFSIPKGWLKTGRMWGRGGHWVLQDPAKFSISDNFFFSFRRIVRYWRIADARASGSPRRLVSARSMLKCTDRALSSVMGVSEWLEDDVSGVIFNYLSQNHL